LEEKNYSAIWEEIEEKERLRHQKQEELGIKEEVKLDETKQAKVDERYA